MEQRLLIRARLLGLIAVTAASALLGSVPETNSLTSSIGRCVAMAAVAASACASYRLIRGYIRGERVRTGAVADAARLEGVTLATNTVRHHVGNRLAVVAGYSELLAEDPRLPAALQVEANKIYDSAVAAADIIHHLHDKMGQVQPDTASAGPALLFLQASNRPPKGAAAEGPIPSSVTQG